MVKGHGTFAILNSNPSSPSTVLNSFAVDYTDNFDAFYPYRYDDTMGWVNYYNNSISTLQGFQTGSIVVRFDQVKSSEDKLALLVDNNLYINPIDFNTQNLDWFDHIFAYTLQNWATKYILINNSEIDTSEEKAAFQYLFDRHKWDFNKMWKDEGGEFNIVKEYKASIYSTTSSGQTKYYLLSYEILQNNQQKYYKYEGNDPNPDLTYFTTSGWHYISVPRPGWSGDPDRNKNIHILRIPVTVGGTTYTIQLKGTKNNNGNTDLELKVFDNNNNSIYTSVLSDVDTDKAMGLFDTLDGTQNEDKLTIGKLAWVMSAFTKGDNKIIEDVSRGVKSGSAVSEDKLKDKSKDFANSRLEGLYQSYLNYLNQNNGNNNLPITSNPQPNQNYFPFLYNGFVGNKFANMGIEGAVNNVAERGSNSVLIVNGYSEKDVKLQGMVFVGNQLKARTGSNNNLLFQGNLIVGNTNITNSGNVNIKGVKNTIFYFDLNSIDLNLLNGAFIRLVPILYRQESVISK